MGPRGAPAAAITAVCLIYFAAQRNRSLTDKLCLQGKNVTDEKVRTAQHARTPATTMKCFKGAKLSMMEAKQCCFRLAGPIMCSSCSLDTACQQRMDRHMDKLFAPYTQQYLDGSAQSLASQAQREHNVELPPPVDAVREQAECELLEEAECELLEEVCASRFVATAAGEPPILMDGWDRI